MPYNVDPSHNNLVGYEIVALPTKGILKLGSQGLKVGDVVSERDVVSGRFFYEHIQKLVGITEDTDSFQFRLYDRGVTITSSDVYSECMPEREISVPADGIYTFSIVIRSSATPIGYSRDLTILEHGAVIIDFNYLGASGAGLTSDDLIFQVTEPPKQGQLLLNGSKATMFTFRDISEKRLSYKHTGSLTPDIMRFRVCTMMSKCVDQTLTLKFREKLKFTGPNVFYAMVGTKWRVELSANRDPVLWTLVNGSTETPEFAPENTGFIQWSYYDSVFEGSDEILRGAGHDKLPEYRNIPFAYQWKGGLPEGIMVDNAGGTVITATKLLYVNNDQSPWFLPAKPGTYKWTMEISDPKTGEKAQRTYTLHVNQSGTNDAGLTSERTD